MRVEGHFTADEVMAAVRVYNATGTPLTFGRMAITFPSRADYMEWITEQTRLYPERWNHAVRIRPRRQKRMSP